MAEAHTYFVGEGQWLVHNACNKVALGIEAHLDEFTESVGGMNWKQFASEDPNNWKVYFMDVMNDESNTIYFNLDGVEVWQGVQRAASGRGGATDWELLQIRNNPDWWDRIIWKKEGQVVDNPFE